MPKHPYAQFEGGPVWRAIEGAIRALVKNQDLTVTTAPHYVIGYLCQALQDAGLVNPVAPQRKPAE